MLHRPGVSGLRAVIEVHISLSLSGLRGRRFWKRRGMQQEWEVLERFMVGMVWGVGIV